MREVIIKVTDTEKAKSASIKTKRYGDVFAAHADMHNFHMTKRHDTAKNSEDYVPHKFPGIQ